MNVSFYIIFSKINRKSEQVWTDTSLFTYFQFQKILETLIYEKNCRGFNLRYKCKFSMALLRSDGGTFCRRLSTPGTAGRSPTG